MIIIANSIFDCDNYLEVLEKDIRATSARVFISSPSLSAGKVRWLLSLLQNKNISAIVFATDPAIYPEDGREHHIDLIQRLQITGVRVILKKHCCERYAVIDDSLVWYGSMNLLSQKKADDSLMRLVSPVIAEELLGISSTEIIVPQMKPIEKE